jgi:hypothetical protein
MAARPPPAQLRVLTSDGAATTTPRPRSGFTPGTAAGGAGSSTAKRASHRFSAFLHVPSAVPDLAEVPVKFEQIVPLFTSEHIRSYCNGLIQAHLRAGGREDGPIPELRPTEQEAFAAVVMVDVSGYSKLSAYLAEAGPEGSHQLTCIMKGYLDKVRGVRVCAVCASVCGPVAGCRSPILIHTHTHTHPPPSTLPRSSPPS